MQLAGHCMSQGLMIGRTNRSFENLNNTVCLTPALIAGKSEIDDMISMMDKALTETPVL